MRDKRDANDVLFVTYDFFETLRDCTYETLTIPGQNDIIGLYQDHIDCSRRWKSIFLKQLTIQILLF